jgi:hypothetical protein
MCREVLVEMKPVQEIALDLFEPLKPYRVTAVSPGIQGVIPGHIVVCLGCDSDKQTAMILNCSRSIVARLNVTAFRGTRAHDVRRIILFEDK